MCGVLTDAESDVLWSRLGRRRVRRGRPREGVAERKPREGGEIVDLPSPIGPHRILDLPRAPLPRGRGHAILGRRAREWPPRTAEHLARERVTSRKVVCQGRVPRRRLCAEPQRLHRVAAMQGASSRQLRKRAEWTPWHARCARHVCECNCMHVGAVAWLSPIRLDGADYALSLPLD